MAEQDNKACCAMICCARYWVPSLRRTVSVWDNVHVTDWPTDAEFIKNTAYDECELPGEVWDEHANMRAENEAGWLCAYHARGDKSVLPTAAVDDLPDVDKLFHELNLAQKTEADDRELETTPEADDESLL
jgi:hypothetical protein